MPKPHKESPNPEVQTLPIDILGKHCGRVGQGQKFHKVPQSILQRALTIFSTERRCEDVAQPMISRKVSVNVTHKQSLTPGNNVVQNKTPVLLAQRKPSLALATFETEALRTRFPRQEIIECAANTSNTWAPFHPFPRTRFFKGRHPFCVAQCIRSKTWAL